MSSLTTCSGQGMLVQGKEKEKECVVEDIRNKSSHSPSALVNLIFRLIVNPVLNYTTSGKTISSEHLIEN